MGGRGGERGGADEGGGARERGIECMGAWEASTLEKSHPDSLLRAIRNC